MILIINPNGNVGAECHTEPASALIAPRNWARVVVTDVTRRTLEAHRREDGTLPAPSAAGVLTWDDIRLGRAPLLDACDWTQVPDAPMSEEVRAAWRAYRQALRDLTELHNDPNAVEWPTPPAL